MCAVVKKLMAMLLVLVCTVPAPFAALAAGEAEANAVKQTAVLISSATADERQDIFLDLIWYMIFVDGADAVDNAFRTVSAFFAEDEVTGGIIPDEYDARIAEAAPDADESDSDTVRQAAALIAAATADERQEIFADLIWYMIFVDGAEAVERAFKAVGMFFAGDNITEGIIPAEYEAIGAGPTELFIASPVEKEDAYAVEVLNAYIADEVQPYQGKDGKAFFAAEEGRTCVALEMRFTCLETERIVPEDIIECGLIYDGAYNYDGTVFAQLRGEYVPGASVQPLCSEYVTLVFEIPESVGTSGKPLEVRLAVKGDEYIFTVRE